VSLFHFFLLLSLPGLLKSPVKLLDIIANTY